MHVLNSFDIQGRITNTECFARTTSRSCAGTCILNLTITIGTNVPRGKESTEVRKSQIKGKESKNSYQELKRSRKGQAHTNTQKLLS